MNDLTPMPFGKYKGKPLQDVPASYLLWLWDDGVWNNRSHVMHSYIKESFSALVQDSPDTIVQHQPKL